MEAQELKNYEVHIKYRNQCEAKYEWNITKNSKEIVAYGYTKTLKEAFVEAYKRYEFVNYALNGEVQI